MVISATIELRSSRQELLQLMEQQSESLLESLMLASDNALRADNYTESVTRARLLDNANLVLSLFQNHEINNSELDSIVGENRLSSVAIATPSGGIIYASTPSPDTLFHAMNLEVLFETARDTVVFGFYHSAASESIRKYVVIRVTREQSAAIVSIDASQMLQFRRSIGFGVLLRDITVNKGIVYAALQDTVGILAASGNVSELEPIHRSPFLHQAMVNSGFSTRQTRFDDTPVFEAVQPFYFNDVLVGIFRLGLSLQPLDAINARIYRRITIMTLVLFGLGFLLFVAVIARQNYDLLQRQYSVVETYSGNIIDHVGDAIIVANSERKIQIFNRAAGTLFGIKTREAIGMPLSTILNDQTCNKILEQPENIQEVSCEIRGHERYLLASQSRFQDEKGSENIILVIRDLTEQRRLEAQAQRNERLTAMGELASGVAHEIRNPLNAIGTIVQQLGKDFVPVKDADEYYELTQLVIQEVKRINKAIRHFLEFTRPMSVRMEPFQLNELINKIQREYDSLTRERHIDFQVAQQWNGIVQWDRSQIQQVLMNLIQNGIDAIGEQGALRLSISEIDDEQLELRIEDDGPGIPKEIQQKIFNLYYTTKPQGTGIGLSIVQRIVIEHDGIISVKSDPGKGTTFVIVLPKMTRADSASNIRG